MLRKTDHKNLPNSPKDSKDLILFKGNITNFEDRLINFEFLKICLKVNKKYKLLPCRRSLPCNLEYGKKEHYELIKDKILNKYEWVNIKILEN